MIFIGRTIFNSDIEAPIHTIQKLCHDHVMSCDFSYTAPQYKSDPGLLYEVQGGTLLLDWTEAFIYNGQLTRYELYIRQMSTSRLAEKKYPGIDTRYSVIIGDQGMCLYDGSGSFVITQ